MVQFGKLKIGTDKVALERTRGEAEAAVAQAQAEAAIAEAEADAEDTRYWAERDKENAAEAARIAAMTFSDDQVHNIELLSTFLEQYFARGFACKGTTEYHDDCDFKVYSSCKSKLEAFFSVQENKLKYQSQYIKFLEIKALHKLTNFRNASYEKYGEVSFDNYGKAMKPVQKEVQRMLQEGSSAAQSGTSNIVYAPQTERFWTDWGKGKKIGYVILNIYTLCIPLIIHIIVFFVKKASNKSK